jgi:hypothetical protein
MVDGFWVAQVQALQGVGGGVVVLTKGRIFGGDTSFYYIGSYTLEGAVLRARVTVRKFLAEAVSIFGIEGDYELDLTGTVQGDVIEGKAVLADTRAVAGLVVRLTKRGELP